jgi:hypothetical protein
VAGELVALIGVEDFRPAMVGECFLLVFNTEGCVG